MRYFAIRGSLQTEANFHDSVAKSLTEVCKSPRIAKKQYCVELAIGVHDKYENV